VERSWDTEKRWLKVGGLILLTLALIAAPKGWDLYVKARGDQVTQGFLKFASVQPPRERLVDAYHGNYSPLGFLVNAYVLEIDRSHLEVILRKAKMVDAVSLYGPEGAAQGKAGLIYHIQQLKGVNLSGIDLDALSLQYFTPKDTREYNYYGVLYDTKTSLAIYYRVDTWG